MIWSDSALVFSLLPRIGSPPLTSHLPAVLFCLPAKNNQLSGYYDPNSVVTAELADSIPEGIDTVFWEYVAAAKRIFILLGERGRKSRSLGANPLLRLFSYYHTISAPYEAKVKQHWQLAGKAPWMASGVWTWSR